MLTKRFSTIVVALIVVALALMTASMIPAGSTSEGVVQSKEQALHEYQLGERYGVLPENINPFSAEQIQREYILGERYGVTPQEYTLEQALREFWLGERYGQTPQELAHTPVIAVTGTNAGFSIYLLSERTLVDPQAGMAAYFNSERTSIPVLFTKYQRSEWFGE